MRRYRGWREQAERLWRKLKGLVHKSKETRLSVDVVNCNRLYWANLEADPDEVHPRRWGRQVPASVVRLRSALDELYVKAKRGPVLDLVDWDGSAVLQRLTALGYVEV